MHKVGSIRIVPHRILSRIMNLVPNVATDGELVNIITKALKHLLRIIMKKSGVTSLRIQDLMHDVVQNIEVGLQIHCLSISRITIKIHVLVLLYSHILILSKLR